MERLAVLRASIPAIPMATDLDILETVRKEEEDEEEMLCSPTEAEEEVDCKEDSCHCHAPILRLKKAVQERDEALHTRSETNKSIKKDNLKLISDLQRARKKYQLLKRQMGVGMVKALNFQAESDTDTKQEEHDQATGTGDQREEPTESGSTCKLIFPGSAMSVFIEGFRKTCEGPNPNYKLSENCASKVKRVTQFLNYMAKNETYQSSLIFLTDHDKIRKWVQFLQKNKAITTVNHYTLTIGAFLKYSEETPPPGCRLTVNQWRGINRLMKGISKSMRRPVSLHQVKVKDNKEGKVVSKKSLLECQSLAKAKIPQVLKTLEETRTQRNQYRFYGYLCAYFTSIYGHRPGLYKNMLVKEVEEAKCDQSGMYLINVGEHKTNREYGMVQMSLTKEEYSWFSDFLKFKHCLLGGKKAQHFFFNSTNTQMKNLPANLREVWKEMGLPECPSFTDLRTSIVTHVKNMLPKVDRERVANFMCHNIQTADKYYAMNLNPTQANETRALFEAALKGEDNTVAAENQPSTSGERKQKVREDASLSDGSTTPEETKVMYQESGTSSGDSEEEEEDEDEEQMARQPPETPPKVTNPQVEMELTPKRKRSICRRHMVVAISPMLVSPLKVTLKSPHHSPIVTIKGMQRLNSNKVRLKSAIASRRLKLQEKVQKRGGDP
ncbi:uncharacterized protein LOC127928571 [Oncorhynchus keta]|uniref:uncharacterized protein LOC127928571 n=1 Tax=Oncorhynchus keta TaxID=8018 RepID=UPI00227A3DEA|nr:uncharacterized protein LOC127928571 [Oncorhynchus keta]